MLFEILTFDFSKKSSSEERDKKLTNFKNLVKITDLPNPLCIISLQGWKLDAKGQVEDERKA